MAVRLIIICLTISLMGIGLFFYQKTISYSGENVLNNKDLLLRKGGMRTLIQQENVDILIVNDSKLWINQDYLSFKQEPSIHEKSTYYVPIKKRVWEGYLRLWFPNDGRDSLISEASAIEKIKLFCRNTNKEVGDSLIFDVFIKQLQTNQEANLVTFIRNNELVSQRIKTLNLSEDENLKLSIFSISKMLQSSNIAIVCLLFSILLPLFYLAFQMCDNRTILESEIINNSDNLPQKTLLKEKKEDGLSSEVIIEYNKFKSESIQIQHYMDKFHEQYHDFYDEVQKLHNQPTKIQKQQIKRKMVEMALHVYTLMMVYKLQKIGRMQEEPNIALILNNGEVEQINKANYREFNTDPYNMPQRIRFLKKIIDEIDIGDNLNVFLNDVYVPKEYWK